MKAAIYVIICLSFSTGLIQCSCLSYGHSCWGGHGKRASIVTSHKVEMASQPDRWALFKVIQEGNNNVFHRERNIRISQDDSLDFIGHKAQDNPMQAINKQSIPLDILNSAEENAASQSVIRNFPENYRKRRAGSHKKRLYVDSEYDTTNAPNTDDDTVLAPSLREYKLIVE